MYRGSRSPDSGGRLSPGRSAGGGRRMARRSPSAARAAPCPRRANAARAGGARARLVGDMGHHAEQRHLGSARCGTGPGARDAGRDHLPSWQLARSPVLARDRPPPAVGRPWRRLPPPAAGDPRRRPPAAPAVPALRPALAASGALPPPSRAGQGPAPGGRTGRSGHLGPPARARAQRLPQGLPDRRRDPRRPRDHRDHRDRGPRRAVCGGLGVNPDGSIKACELITNEELGAALGGEAEALPMGGLVDGTVGRVLDQRVLPDAPDCWIVGTSATAADRTPGPPGRWRRVR